MKPRFCMSTSRVLCKKPSKLLDFLLLMNGLVLLYIFARSCRHDARNNESTGQQQIGQKDDPHIKCACKPCVAVNCVQKKLKKDVADNKSKWKQAENARLKLESECQSLRASSKRTLRSRTKICQKYESQISRLKEKRDNEKKRFTEEYDQLSADINEVLMTLIANQARYLVELDTVRKTYDRYVRQQHREIDNMDCHDYRPFIEDWQDDNGLLTDVLEQKTDKVCTYCIYLSSRAVP